MNANLSIFISNEISISIKPEANRRSELAHVPPVPDPKAAPAVEVAKQMTVAGESLQGSSEDLLLQRVASGEREPLEILFRRLAVPVRRVGLRILKDPGEADDLLQSVFLLVFQRAALFDSSKSSASSWIIQIAYHRAFDRRRYLISRHFYTHQEFDDSTLRSAGQTANSSPDGQSIESILGKELMTKFNRWLSSEQRETVHLHLIEDFTFKEIAERTGRSLGNVRGHYYRGIERMRRYVLPETTRLKGPTQG